MADGRAGRRPGKPLTRALASGSGGFIDGGGGGFIEENDPRYQPGQDDPEEEECAGGQSGKGKQGRER